MNFKNNSEPDLQLLAYKKNLQKMKNHKQATIKRPFRKGKRFVFVWVKSFHHIKTQLLIQKKSENFRFFCFLF